MNLKCLDDPDVRNSVLAALDCYYRCIPLTEKLTKIDINQCYKEIQDRIREMEKLDDISMHTWNEQ